MSRWLCKRFRTVPNAQLGSARVPLSTMSKTMSDDGDGGEEEAKEQRCQNCGYKWEYGGDLWTTTCPRCNNKTMTWKDPENGDDVLVK